MAQATFKTKDLTAVVGDNAADGPHRAGYNGLWSLRHASCPRDLFVPGIAGMNLEHVFNGETDDTSQEVFFEPRHAPMELRKLSDQEAELHQPPTPTFHVESWTKFTFRDPDIIDMEFRCVAHQHVFRRGYMGLFWASYIHAPEDKSLYFWGGPEGQGPGWTQLCTQWHNDQSTVRHRNDKLELTFRPENRPSLFRSLSKLRFDLPLFYGRFQEHVWIVMFDRAEGIRLTHSPSGGGFDAERKTSNPAWDWQYIVPNPDVMKPYGFKARALFRPRCSREEVLELYRSWSGNKG
jgi:hypothetical protein